MAAACQPGSRIMPTVSTWSPSSYFPFLLETKLLGNPRGHSHQQVDNKSCSPRKHWSLLQNYSLLSDPTVPIVAVGPFFRFQIKCLIISFQLADPVVIILRFYAIYLEPSTL